MTNLIPICISWFCAGISVGCAIVSVMLLHSCIKKTKQRDIYQERDMSDIFDEHGFRGNLYHNNPSKWI
ncbi:hypothetical protein [Fructilactobacillus fructivorans]|uniref:hypothetical protein n=1 Tax=Fructilactobacillus fructivorans TaxID=1614 RepID=UPI0007055FDF|nr:hypothetical protein [Fructilactobacillus fructivorans]